MTTTSPLISALPYDDDYEIKYVPSIAKIRMFAPRESEGEYFQDALGREYDCEYRLALLNKVVPRRQVGTRLILVVHDSVIDAREQYRVQQYRSQYETVEVRRCRYESDRALPRERNDAARRRVGRGASIEIATSPLASHDGAGWVNVIPR